MLVQTLEETVIDTSAKQMEQWSILITNVKYMQYIQHLTGHHALGVKAAEKRYGTRMYKRLQIIERDVREIDFNPDPDRLRMDYLDVFEGIKSPIHSQCDRDCDIGTTYIGTSNMRKQYDLKAEHRIPITEHFI